MRGADDLLLAGDTWGKPPWDVIFLHGGGQTRRAWGKAPDALARLGLSVLNLDLRGHGESSWDPPGRYSHRDHARDLAAILKPGHRTVLIGASLGGVTSLTASHRARDSIRAIVLVDIAPTTQSQGIKNILDFMTSNPGGFSSIDEAADAVAKFLPHRKARPSAQLEHNLRYSPDTARWTWHWDPKTLDFATDTYLRQQSSDMTAAVRNLDAPMVLVRGQFSDVITSDDVRHFLELSPRARAAEVPEARHMVAGDANDVFLQQIQTELEAALPDWPRRDETANNG
ncbi:alpha/beta fold hydrolase [Nocardia fluminea]|uniref:alpha/beta fold hydrolase n=1 Tax=Nocardia fluminea TaxID=134984 RepID=UPI00342B0991